MSSSSGHDASVAVQQQPTVSSGHAPLELDRRGFIAGSAALALLPLGASAARAQQATASSGSPLRNMSVGYVDGSDLWPSLKAVTAGTLNRGHRAQTGTAVEEHEVVPASSLIAGDQTLASELVRVGVHGLYPVPNPTRIRSAQLTAWFPSDDPASPAPLRFFAWAYKNRPVPSPSSPLKFTAPLRTADGGFQLTLDVVPETGPANVTRRATLSFNPPEPPGGNFVADFTVDWYEGRPKLQRGVYLLGLAGNTWVDRRVLPIVQPGKPRPLELISLIVTIDPIVQ